MSNPFGQLQIEKSIPFFHRWEQEWRTFSQSIPDNRRKVNLSHFWPASGFILPVISNNAEKMQAYFFDQAIKVMVDKNIPGC